MGNQNTSKKATLFVLNFSFLMSALVLTGVLAKVASDGGWLMQIVSESPHHVLYLLFTTLSIVLTILVVFMPAIFPVASEQDQDQQDNPYQSAGFGASGAKNRFYYNGSLEDQKIGTRLTLRLALSEAIILFGFILSMTNQIFFIILPFLAVGVSLQLIFGPFMHFIVSKRNV